MAHYISNAFNHCNIALSVLDLYTMKINHLSVRGMVWFIYQYSIDFHHLSLISTQREVKPIFFFHAQSAFVPP